MYTRNTQFRFVITKLRHVRARARFQTRQLCFIPSFSFRFHSESAGIKRLSLFSAVDHFLSSRMVCMYFSYQHHICDPAALFRCAFRGPRDLSRKRGQKKENERNKSGEEKVKSKKKKKTSRNRKRKKQIPREGTQKKEGKG